MKILQSHSKMMKSFSSENSESEIPIYHHDSRSGRNTFGLGHSSGYDAEQNQCSLSNEQCLTSARSQDVRRQFHFHRERDDENEKVAQLSSTRKKQTPSRECPFQTRDPHSISEMGMHNRFHVDRMNDCWNNRSVSSITPVSPIPPVSQLSPVSPLPPVRCQSGGAFVPDPQRQLNVDTLSSPEMAFLSATINKAGQSGPAHARQRPHHTIKSIDQSATPHVSPCINKLCESTVSSLLPLTRLSGLVEESMTRFTDVLNASNYEKGHSQNGMLSYFKNGESTSNYSKHKKSKARCRKRGQSKDELAPCDPSADHHFNKHYDNDLSGSCLRQQDVVVKNKRTNGKGCGRKPKNSNTIIFKDLQRKTNDTCNKDLGATSSSSTANQSMFSRNSCQEEFPFRHKIKQQLEKLHKENRRQLEFLQHEHSGQVEQLKLHFMVEPLDVEQHKRKKNDVDVMPDSLSRSIASLQQKHVRQRENVLLEHVKQLDRLRREYVVTQCEDCCLDTPYSRLPISQKGDNAKSSLNQCREIEYQVPELDVEIIADIAEASKHHDFTQKDIHLIDKELSESFFNKIIDDPRKEESYKDIQTMHIFGRDCHVEQNSIKNNTRNARMQDRGHNKVIDSRSHAYDKSKHSSEITENCDILAGSTVEIGLPVKQSCFSSLSTADSIKFPFYDATDSFLRQTVLNQCSSQPQRALTQNSTPGSFNIVTVHSSVSHVALSTQHLCMSNGNVPINGQDGCHAYQQELQHRANVHPTKELSYPQGQQIYSKVNHQLNLGCDQQLYYPHGQQFHVPQNYQVRNWIGQQQILQHQNPYRQFHNMTRVPVGNEIISPPWREIAVVCKLNSYTAPFPVQCSIQTSNAYPSHVYQSAGNFCSQSHNIHNQITCSKSITSYGNCPNRDAINTYFPLNRFEYLMPQTCRVFASYSAPNAQFQDSHSFANTRSMNSEHLYYDGYSDLNSFLLPASGTIVDCSVQDCRQLPCLMSSFDNKIFSKEKPQYLPYINSTYYSSSCEESRNSFKQRYFHATNSISSLMPSSKLYTEHTSPTANVYQSTTYGQPVLAVNHENDNVLMNTTQYQYQYHAGIFTDTTVSSTLYPITNSSFALPRMNSSAFCSNDPYAMSTSMVGASSAIYSQCDFMSSSNNQSSFQLWNKLRDNVFSTGFQSGDPQSNEMHNNLYSQDVQQTTSLRVHPDCASREVHGIKEGTCPRTFPYYTHTVEGTNSAYRFNTTISSSTVQSCMMLGEGLHLDYSHSHNQQRKELELMNQGHLKFHGDQYSACQYTSCSNDNLSNLVSKSFIPASDCILEAIYNTLPANNILSDQECAKRVLEEALTEQQTARDETIGLKAHDICALSTDQGYLLSDDTTSTVVSVAVCSSPILTANDNSKQTYVLRHLFDDEGRIESVVSLADRAFVEEKQMPSYMTYGCCKSFPSTNWQIQRFVDSLLAENDSMVSSCDSNPNVINIDDLTNIPIDPYLKVTHEVVPGNPLDTAVALMNFPDSYLDIPHNDQHELLALEHSLSTSIGSSLATSLIENGVCASNWLSHEYCMRNHSHASSAKGNETCTQDLYEDDVDVFSTDASREDEPVSLSKCLVDSEIVFKKSYALANRCKNDLGVEISSIYSLATFPMRKRSISDSILHHLKIRHLDTSQNNLEIDFYKERVRHNSESNVLKSTQKTFTLNKELSSTAIKKSVEPAIERLNTLDKVTMSPQLSNQNTKSWLEAENEAQSSDVFNDVELGTNDLIGFSFETSSVCVPITQNDSTVDRLFPRLPQLSTPMPKATTTRSFQVANTDTFSNSSDHLSNVASKNPFFTKTTKMDNTERSLSSVTSTNIAKKADEISSNQLRSLAVDGCPVPLHYECLAGDLFSIGHNRYGLEPDTDNCVDVDKSASRVLDPVIEICVGNMKKAIDDTVQRAVNQPFEEATRELTGHDKFDQATPVTFSIAIKEETGIENERRTFLNSNNDDVLCKTVNATKNVDLRSAGDVRSRVLHNWGKRCHFQTTKRKCTNVIKNVSVTSSCQTVSKTKGHSLKKHEFSNDTAKIIKTQERSKKIRHATTNSTIMEDGKNLKGCGVRGRRRVVEPYVSGGSIVNTDLTKIPAHSTKVIELAQSVTRETSHSINTLLDTKTSVCCKPGIVMDSLSINDDLKDLSMKAECSDPQTTSANNVFPLLEDNMADLYCSDFFPLLSPSTESEGVLGNNKDRQDGESDCLRVSESSFDNNAENTLSASNIKDLEDKEADKMTTHTSYHLKSSNIELRNVHESVRLKQCLRCVDLDGDLHVILQDLNKCFPQFSQDDIKRIVSQDLKLMPRAVHVIEIDEMKKTTEYPFDAVLLADAKNLVQRLYSLPTDPEAILKSNMTIEKCHIVSTENLTQTCLFKPTIKYAENMWMEDDDVYGKMFSCSTPYGRRKSGNELKEGIFEYDNHKDSDSYDSDKTLPYEDGNPVSTNECGRRKWYLNTHRHLGLSKHSRSFSSDTDQPSHNITVIELLDKEKPYLPNLPSFSASPFKDGNACEIPMDNERILLECFSAPGSLAPSSNRSAPSIRIVSPERTDTRQFDEDLPNVVCNEHHSENNPPSQTSVALSDVDEGVRSAVVLESNFNCIAPSTDFETTPMTSNATQFEGVKNVKGSGTKNSICSMSARLDMNEDTFSELGYLSNAAIGLQQQQSFVNPLSDCAVENHADETMHPLDGIFLSCGSLADERARSTNALSSDLTHDRINEMLSETKCTCFTRERFDAEGIHQYTPLNISAESISGNYVAVVKNDCNSFLPNIEKSVVFSQDLIHSDRFMELARRISSRRRQSDTTIAYGDSDEESSVYEISLPSNVPSALINTHTSFDSQICSFSFNKQKNHTPPDSPLRSLHDTLCQECQCPVNEHLALKSDALEDNIRKRVLAFIENGQDYIPRVTFRSNSLPNLSRLEALDTARSSFLSRRTAYVRRNSYSEYHTCVDQTGLRQRMSMNLQQLFRDTENFQPFDSHTEREANPETVLRVTHSDERVNSIDDAIYQGDELQDFHQTTNIVDGGEISCQNTADSSIYIDEDNFSSGLKLGPWLCTPATPIPLMASSDPINVVHSPFSFGPCSTSARQTDFTRQKSDNASSTHEELNSASTCLNSNSISEALIHSLPINVCSDSVIAVDISCKSIKNGGDISIRKLNEIMSKNLDSPLALSGEVTSLENKCMSKANTFICGLKRKHSNFAEHTEKRKIYSPKYDDADNVNLCEVSRFQRETQQQSEQVRKRTFKEITDNCIEANTSIAPEIKKWNRNTEHSTKLIDTLNECVSMTTQNFLYNSRDSSKMSFDQPRTQIKQLCSSSTKNNNRYTAKLTDKVSADYEKTIYRPPEINVAPATPNTSLSNLLSSTLLQQNSRYSDVQNSAANKSHRANSVPIHKSFIVKPPAKRSTSFHGFFPADKEIKDLKGM